MPPQDITGSLREILSGNIVILGVGNIDKGDDGAGSTLVQEINGRVSATCIDAGVAPENFLEKIVSENPDTVVIVDAADFGAEPGEVRLFEPAQISQGAISTHALSLDTACDYLTNRMPVKVYLLAIQPERTASEGLSPAVQESLRSLEDRLRELLPRKKGD